MKKILALTLAIMMLLSALVGCNTTPPPNSDETQNQTPVTPPELNYDGTVIFKPGDGDQSTDNNTTPPGDSGNQPTTPPSDGGDQPVEPPLGGEVVTGEFVTMYKTYTYKGHDVAIIKLENHTTQNYTVTINAKYLDADGNELKTETQTFEGFPSGWENHFFFNPGIRFSNFTYTLTAQEFSGECGVNSNSQAYFTRIFETKMHHIVDGHIDVEGGKVPTLSAEFQFENFKASLQILTELVIDKNGEICAIHRYEASGGGSGTKSWPIYQTTEDELIIPENLQGELIGVVCFHSVQPLN